MLLDGSPRLFQPDEPLTMAPQKIVERFDSNLDGSEWPVLVDVLERKEGCSGTLDDLLDDRVDRRVVAALEARQLERDEVGMTCDELGGPNLLIRAGDRRVLPDIADVE